MRVPISCESCRKRKVKCDKLRPTCGHCIKSNQTCKYEEMKSSEENATHILNLGTVNMSTNHSSQSKVDNYRLNQSQNGLNKGKLNHTNSNPKKRQASGAYNNESFVRSLQPATFTFNGNSTNNANVEQTLNEPRDPPFYSKDDVIDFYHGYSSLQINDSRVLNHGPLSWITLVKKDSHVKSVWSKVLGSSARSSLILQSANSVEEDERDADDATPVQAEAEADSGTKETSYNRRMLGYTTAFRPNNEMATIQLILKILPERRYIWSLIDCFFEFVYPFMPYLDFENFLRQVTKIIGPRLMDNVKLQYLGITKRLDFAIVGILLLILRFAHLSVQNNANNYTKNSGTLMESLVGLDISVEFPDAAQHCLNQFRLLRSSNLEILQCALYMRIYYRYSPEDGDSADSDSRAYNGMLFQMAISIGLNRDPETLLSAGVKNPKLCQLRRKMWFALQQLETYQSLVLGNPSYTGIVPSNVKYPPVTDENSNSSVPGLEKFVNFWLNRFESRRPVAHRLNALVLNFDGTTKVSELVSLLDNMEAKLGEEYGSMNKLLNTAAKTYIERLYKVRSIQNYLETSSTIFSVHFHLFLKYDSQANSRNAYHYFKKLLTISNELMAIMPELFTLLHKYVGYGFDYYLTPTILVAAHRVIQAQFTLFSRLSFYNLLLTITPAKPDNARLAKSIKKFILKTVRVHITELRKLTPKYYYAWKMYKAQDAIYNMIKEDVIFEIKDGIIVANKGTSYETKMNHYSFLSDISLEELKQLYEHEVLKATDLDELTIPKQNATQAVSPAALSHILNNPTPTNSASSPDSASRENFSNTSSKEVDDLWMEILNKKKENDPDEEIVYENHFKKLEDAEQARQLQQPDFSSLLVMQPSLSQSKTNTQENTQLPGATSAIYNSNENNNNANWQNRSSGRFQQGETTAELPQQPDHHMAPHEQQQQQQQQQTAAQHPPLQVNLNNLMEDPLNFNQLFASFHDFV